MWINNNVGAKVTKLLKAKGRYLLKFIIFFKVIVLNKKEKEKKGKHIYKKISRSITFTSQEISLTK